MWWCMPVISSLRRLRQENHNLRPAWATLWECVSKKEGYEKRKESASTHLILSDQWFVSWGLQFLSPDWEPERFSPILLYFQCLTHFQLVFLVMMMEILYTQTKWTSSSQNECFFFLILLVSS
jgi:hypothetical protein